VAQALVPFIKAGGKPGVPAAAEKGAPFADLERAPVPTRASRKATKGREAAKPAPAAWWKRLPVLAGAAAAVLALAVGAFFLGGMFSKPGVPAPEPSSGTGGPVVPPLLPGSILENSSIRMKFAWIPPGSFRMGGDKFDDEKPVHRVTITKGFYMGVSPVTQQQWQEVMGNNPSNFKGDDSCPVEQVSWEDCRKFCDALKKRDGRPYRLPTEAEWEYACRAGTTMEYYTGDGEDALKKAGWYLGNSGDKTHPVGQLAKNDWGLYDMHGNVWQWCADYYGPYKDLKDTDPFRLEKGAEDARVLRGGSWNYGPLRCRAAYRLGVAPSRRSFDYGFRVAFRLD